MTSPEQLVHDVVQAHGGLSMWRSISSLAVRLSDGGFAFRSKGHWRGLRNITARTWPQQRRTFLEPYPRPGMRGVFDDGVVRIETIAGDVIAERREPREEFSKIRRLFRWDDLDMLYFHGYAFWTYMTAPFVWLEPGFEVSELGPWEEQGQRWRRLLVTYPPAVHTHSRQQVFYIDSNSLIHRHDYTAEPIGKWAKAAHYCFDWSYESGIAVARRRRVVPRGPGNRPLPGPVLVWIEMADVTIESAQGIASQGA